MLKRKKTNIFAWYIIAIREEKKEKKTIHEHIQKKIDKMYIKKRLQ